MLRRAVIPSIITIPIMMIWVGSAWPSHHHQLQADGKLRRSQEANGLMCQCTCGCGTAEHTKNDQCGQHPHGLSPHPKGAHVVVQVGDLSITANALDDTSDS